MLKSIFIKNYVISGKPVDVEINMLSDNKIASKTKTLGGNNYHLTACVYPNNVITSFSDIILNAFNVCFEKNVKIKPEKLFNEESTIFEFEYLVKTSNYFYTVEINKYGFVSQSIYKDNLMIWNSYKNERSLEMFEYLNDFHDCFHKINVEYLNHKSIINVNKGLVKNNITYKNVLEALLNKTGVADSNIKLLDDSFEILVSGSYRDVDLIVDTQISKKIAICMLVAEKILTNLDNSVFVIINPFKVDTFFFNSLVKLINKDSTAQFIFVSDNYYFIPEIIKYDSFTLNS